MLRGKKAVVVGVATKHSLAWAVAKAWSNAGAHVLVSCQNERLAEKVKPLMSSLNDLSASHPPLICDWISSNEQGDDQRGEFAASVSKVFDGSVDSVFHSIAYAPPDSLRQPISDLSMTDFVTAQTSSVYTLVSLAHHMKPLFKARGGGSLQTLSYVGSSRVIPSYRVMGPAKAALEATVRELAVDLGSDNVRVNALSPGPIATLAARGIPGISKMIDYSKRTAPLERTTSVEDVGNVATFLASDTAACITGQTIYADCGFSILSPLPRKE